MVTLSDKFRKDVTKKKKKSHSVALKLKAKKRKKKKNSNNNPHTHINPEFYELARLFFVSYVWLANCFHLFNRNLKKEKKEAFSPLHCCLNHLHVKANSKHNNRIDTVNVLKQT